MPAFVNRERELDGRELYRAWQDFHSGTSESRYRITLTFAVEKGAPQLRVFDCNGEPLDSCVAGVALDDSTMNAAWVNYCESS